MESAFDGLNFDDEDNFIEGGSLAKAGPSAAPLPEEKPLKSIKCPFTVIIDSAEQQPLPFSGLTAVRDGVKTSIAMKTIRKRLRTGDYQINGMPSGIVIERKGLPDLFGSVSPGQRRDDFVERLRRMDANFQHGVILVEAYPDEVLRMRQGGIRPDDDEIDRLAESAYNAYNNNSESSYMGFHSLDEGEKSAFRRAAIAVYRDSLSRKYGKDISRFTSLNPKVVVNTAISWGLAFPHVHWHWCRDRDEAATVAYTLMDKFYEHEMSTKYKHHNKPLDQAIDAYEEGFLSRMNLGDFSVPYPPGNHLRLDFMRGWAKASILLYEGDPGLSLPQPATSPSKGKKKGPTPEEERAELLAFFGKMLK